MRFSTFLYHHFPTDNYFAYFKMDGANYVRGDYIGETRHGQTGLDPYTSQK